MSIKEKKEKLIHIYNRFEQDISEFKGLAVCQIGCADCCINVGSIDITTLEGIIIYQRTSLLPKPLKIEIKEKLIQNKMEKEANRFARCPFLKEDNTCSIYDIRPFSCRRLYSVKRCNGGPPTIHRQAVELGNKAVKEMQRLDDTGYSGHISFILHLLNKPKFRKTYLSGRFDPERIKNFGIGHDILINRLASPSDLASSSRNR
jgi:Fe-S-cluster containining protein